MFVAFVIDHVIVVVYAHIFLTRFKKYVCNRRDGKKEMYCIKFCILILIQSLLLVFLMIVGQGSTAPEEGLVCLGQFQSAVSEALALRDAFQAKSAEIKRLLDTCDRAVADDCCQVYYI